MHSIFEQLVNSHNKFHESSIKRRRFKYEDIISLITDLESKEGFYVGNVGRSFEGREIFCVRWGNGPIDLLLWSQMHGDESTATRALLDIWNFLSAEKDVFDDLRNELADKVTFHFVAVLNPDGTNMWQRRTLQDIDMNRDAVRFQTPEARILKKLCDQVKPLFGFNLHDQSIYYSAGHENKPATISFLAPAFNKSKEINEVRGRAMKIIGYMNRQLQGHISGQVAKYDDTYNPRAFGDNIQKWGISTVLIESGGYYNDPEKEFIRKLNFALILDGAAAVANNEYAEVGVDEYEDIPFNEKEHFFDLLIRNAVIKRNGLEYKVDIAINREETDYNNHRDFYYRGRIADIGDMSLFYGYEEVDLNGMEIEPGKVFPFVFETHEEALKHDMKKVLSNGYTSVVVDDALINEQFTSLPVNIHINEDQKEHEIAIDEFANFIGKEEGEVKFVVVNGFIYHPENKNPGIANGLVMNS